MLLMSSYTVQAANGITEITQIDATKTTAYVEWDAVLGVQGYYVQYSTDGVVWFRDDEEDDCPDTEDAFLVMKDLSAGKSYYVRVAPVKIDKYNQYYVSAEYSAPFEVVTAPACVESDSIVQTGASYNSISLVWDGVSGATGYCLFLNENSYDTGTVADADTQECSSTLVVDEHSRNSVSIAAYRESSSGFRAMYSNTLNNSKAFELKASPGMPENLANKSMGYLAWMPSESNKVTVGWDNSSDCGYVPDGYEVDVRNCVINALRNTVLLKRASPVNPLI